ncbi:hypothetical protein EVAR_4633_1 [Eumeta japonica]|uniref:Uncharacterized protein n=1 Tax=Eumeta variegata TaxID=151549 RepID=A0A4C1SX30_EUMVA|nr:hypothetical protein EVAR_4633_1 [Eumeta japonica]
MERQAVDPACYHRVYDDGRQRPSNSLDMGHLGSKALDIQQKYCERLYINAKVTCVVVPLVELGHDFWTLERTETAVRSLKHAACISSMRVRSGRRDWRVSDGLHAACYSALQANV